MKTLFRAVAFCLLAMALPCAAFAANQMKIAHGNPQDADDPYQVLALAFQEQIKKSGVDLEVVIFPAGQVGSEQTAFQDVQNGILQGAVLASNNISSFATSYSVLDLPFIFTSIEDFNKVLEANGRKLTDVLIKESETRPVAWGVQGFRVLSNSKRPVKTLADLKGIKIRLPNNAIQLATFKAWDCEGVPLAFGELFGALQQHVVDGLEMTYVSLANQKYYEVQSYVSDIRYKLAINPLVVSESWFQEQTPEVQKAILEAGKVATAKALAAAEGFDEVGKKTLAEHGVQLEGRPADEAEWIKRSHSVWPQFYSLIKDQALFDDVLKTLNITKP